MPGSCSSTILISSPVTPWYVAPPLSPRKTWTHGGDRGASVWRGGLPLQFFLPPSGGVVGLPLSVRAGGPSPSPPGAPPWVRLLLVARLSDERFPFCCCGGLSLLGGTGASSSVVAGFACGRLSDDGRMAMARAIATARASSGG